MTSSPKKYVIEKWHRCHKPRPLAFLRKDRWTFNWRIAHLNTQVILNSETFNRREDRNDSARRFSEATGIAMVELGEL